LGPSKNSRNKKAKRKMGAGLLIPGKRNGKNPNKGKRGGVENEPRGTPKIKGGEEKKKEEVRGGRRGEKTWLEGKDQEDFCDRATVKGTEGGIGIKPPTAKKGGRIRGIHFNRSVLLAKGVRPKRY